MDMNSVPLVFVFLVFIPTTSLTRMQRDFTYPVVEDFSVYWNVPTSGCQKHGFHFGDLTSRYGITVNTDDQFRGDCIIILYDPGLFPAMLEDSSGNTTKRNGGIPQLGNLTAHLDAFKTVVENSVPEDFCGHAVIDFETWRPQFRQNWNYQAIHKDMSRDLVCQMYPYLSPKEVEAKAKEDFEKFAKVFMLSTLTLAKRLRPGASWGYYGFPHCYNMRPDSGMQSSCHKDVEVENDSIQWLFDESTALYPSLYMGKSFTTNECRHFVMGRLNEAWRVACRAPGYPIPTVNPYIWFKYYDDDTEFMSKMDMYHTLDTTQRYRMGGAVIWGATNDVNTKEKCQQLWDYVKNTLGPIVILLRRSNHQWEPCPEEYNILEEEALDANLSSTSAPTCGTVMPTDETKTSMTVQPTEETKTTIKVQPTEETKTTITTVQPTENPKTPITVQPTGKPKLSDALSGVLGIGIAIITGNKQ